MLGFAQFVTRKAQVVRALDQIHASFQRLKPMSGMTTIARVSSQPLTHRRIEPLNKRYPCGLRSCMRLLPSPILPLGEHTKFGQNCFDAYIGFAVLFCMHKMPRAIFIFKGFPFFTS